MDHPLLQFCQTQEQADAVTLTEIEGLSQREAASRLGICRTALRDRLTVVKNKAAKRGYSPNNDWNHPVPDGHKIKGVSTFYDEDGKPVRQWVKS